MTKDSEEFGTGLEWVWKVGLFLDENWKGFGKALERRGGVDGFPGGAILSAGAVPRCSL